VKKTFQAASAVFAVIPGIAMLTSKGFAPREETTMFGIVLPVVGVATLLIMLLFKKNIAVWSPRYATKFAIVSLFIALVSVSCYYSLYRRCEVKVEGFGTNYFPLLTTGRLSKHITTNFTREKVIRQYQETGVQSLIEEQPLVLRVGTTLLLLFCLAMSCVGLVACFGILATRSKGRATGRMF